MRFLAKPKDYRQTQIASLLQISSSKNGFNVSYVFLDPNKKPYKHLKIKQLQGLMV